MPDIDERLQYYLSQIEAGVPKEKVLAALKEGEQELAALIKLADAMRTITHPVPSSAYSRAAKRKVLASATQALPQPKPERGSPLGWLFFPSLTGVIAVFLVLFISLATVGVWLAGPASADVARVQDVEGLVELAENKTGAQWMALSGGETVHSGQQIRTSAGSSVTLVYSDGSQTRLYPETSLWLKEINGTWSGDLQVEIEQTIGKTSHSVTPLRSQTAYYRVHTPAGVAHVTGTSFTVDVQANGVSRVIVDSGQVSVLSAAQEIVLPAGKAVLLQVGAPPQAVGNYFSIVDFVVAIEGKQWIVSGQKLRISDQAYISGVPSIGQALQIEGRILASGEWVADRVAPVEDSARSLFTGVVEAISEGTLRVGGKNITITAFTKLAPELTVGDQVEVTYLTLSDQQWLAVSVNEIGALEGQTAQATATTLLQTALPTPVSESEVEACILAGTTPEIVALAESLTVTPEEILELFCRGLSLEEIEVAYNLSALTNWSVAEIANLRLSGMDWETINATLLQFPQPGEGTEPISCIGVVFEPRVEQLALKYGVTYEEVAELLCSGYSFSSLELAYRLATEVGQGYSPQEILALRSQGMAWGQIKKTLLDSSGQGEGQGPPDKEPKPTKDNKRPEQDENPAAKTPPGLQDKDK